MDAKRGDIGSTAARQAVALFDGLGADAVTVSPYLGEEAIAPLLERADRFAYVLCRTSNPGAGELQGLVVAADGRRSAPEEPLYARVARRGDRLGSRRDRRARRRGDGAGRAGRDPRDRPGPGVPRPRRRRPGRRRSEPVLARRSGDRGAGRRPARRRPARQRLAWHRRGRRSASRHRGRRRRPRRAPSRRPPATGPSASLCYPSRASPAGPVAAPPRSRSQRCRTSGPVELVIILVIALLDPRPGQAARRRRGPRQEHPRVPQGVVGRPGRGQRVDTSPLPPTPPPAAAARPPPRRRPPRAVAAPAAAAVRRQPDRARAERGRAARPPAAAPRATQPAPRPPSREPASAPRRWPTPTPSARAGVPRPAAPAAATRTAAPPARPPTPATVMTLVDHLAELRTRSVRSILAVAVGSAIGFYFATPIIRDSWSQPLPAASHAPGPRPGDAFVDHAPDLGRHRDHPGDAGAALPALGVRRAGPDRQPSARLRPWIPLALFFFVLGVAIAYVVLPFAIAVPARLHDDVLVARSPPARTSTS